MNANIEGITSGRSSVSKEWRSKIPGLSWPADMESFPFLLWLEDHEPKAEIGGSTDKKSSPSVPLFTPRTALEYSTYIPIEWKSIKI